MQFSQCSPLAPRVDRPVSRSETATLTAHLLDTLLAGDGLARSLAGAGVGARPLATHRQTAAVPETAVALDVLQPRDVLLHLTAQRTLDGVFAIENGRQAGDLL